MKIALYWESLTLVELHQSLLEAYGYNVERLFFEISFPPVKRCYPLGSTAVALLYLIYFQLNKRVGAKEPFIGSEYALEA